MTKPTKAFTQTSRAAPPLEHQRAIAAQTEAFLAGGGAITQIPNGVSGQAKLGGPQMPGVAAAAAAASNAPQARPKST